jgi:hypothetical protein
MDIKKLKSLIPLTDVFELEPNHSYAIRIPTGGVGEVFAKQVNLINDLLQPQNIKFIIFADDLELSKIQ